MIASKHGITPIVRAQLGEMDFGGWEGKAFPQLANNSEWNQFNCTRSLVRPPAGEMMVEVQVRMVLEAGDIKSRHEGDTVAIVSHADPIRALIAHYLGSPLDMLSRFAISVASVSVVRFEGQVPTVAAINYQGELER
jgi:probable phosphoglycerate mutase